ncbi:MAG: TraB/GumN family protein [Anaerolineae bacterium]
MTGARKHGRLFGLLLAWATFACPAGADSLFWSVQRAGQPAGYLLGTIHSEDPRVLDFSTDFLDRLQACEVFAMELVPDLMTMGKLRTYMQLDADQSLSGLAGAALFDATAGALAAYGVSREQAERLKPWAAMMTLSQPPPQTGLFMDFALSLRADGYGLRVTGLETLDQQLAFLEHLDIPQQLDLLRQAVDDYPRLDEVHDRMVDVYLEGSLGALQREAGEQMATLPAPLRRYFIEQGIEARNHRMLGRAVPLLDEGCTLVAVGALHLPGPSGLVALLRDEGYTLQALPPPFAAPGTAPVAERPATATLP